jgi:2-oxoisovalerate dehydrogenase E2 component (dihydrolipoyl transacylase)
MATYVIKVPDIGEGIAEVELVHWHVKPGDLIHEEQALADVMTDKANVEIPSPVSGKVLAIAGKPGDVIAVGSELIRLEVEGKGNVGDAEQVKAKPEAPREPKPTAAPILRSVPSPSPPPAPNPNASERPLASPAVRRRARELELDLDEIAGSGPEGRITQEDLEAHRNRTPRGASFSAPLRYNVPPGGRLVPAMRRDDKEVVQVIGLRRKIAEKMQESKRRIPHFTYVEEIDVTALEELRSQLNARWRSERGHLTMLPFLMRAIVRALPDFPEINARYDDEKGTLTRHGGVHIGIATQTGNGLVVPVVRNAEARDLWSCASEVARLAQAARAGKATREELTGSTITITSLGSLGGIVTTPVINHPEVAIVGVNRIVERPVVREGAVVVRQVMNLSSSFDHRIVDGLRAATFVQRLRALIEVPATLFID